MAILKVFLSCVLCCVLAARVSAGPAAHRLYDGLTATIHNPRGRAFTVTLEVRDLNYMSQAPAELLLKVYQPDGKAVVREVLGDDGVVAPMYQSPVAGWDHEAWYYATVRSRGLAPLVKWSAFSAPARLAAMRTRTFTRKIPGGRKGRYKVLIVGGSDHYVTLRLDPDLAYGVSGSVDWLHGHGNMFRKSYFYLPRRTTAIQMMFLQHDRPSQRRMKLYHPSRPVMLMGVLPGGKVNSLRIANGIVQMLKQAAPDQEVANRPVAVTIPVDQVYTLTRDPESKRFVYTTPAGAKLLLRTLERTVIDNRNRKSVMHYYLRQIPAGQPILRAFGNRGLARPSVMLAPEEQDRELILACEVSPGPGDFLLSARTTIDRGIRPWRGPYSVNVVFCPDETTARALRGGAIYHEGQTYWHPFQVRYHNFLKTIKPADFELPANLPKAKAKFISVGSHNRPKPHQADCIMHDYPAHKNPKALNAALKEMQVGMNLIGPGDFIAIGPIRNLAYEMGCYCFFYHRPAWQILQKTDAPKAAKEAIREFVIKIGDRLAFSRSMELVNGNACASLVVALLYDVRATDDPMLKQLYETYWQRITTGGFGSRVGIGPSGGMQESFGYDQHYGSYILRGWRAGLADLKDPRMQAVYDRILKLYSYTYSQKGAKANPWNARTSMDQAGGTYNAWSKKHRWKGLGGPDLLEGVNGHNEWFAARRKKFYMLTYHGRLTPTWMSEGFHGLVGVGGGGICQFQVIGRGPVLASSLNGSYGQGMHPSQWRNFHVHSIVGATADGQPLVSASSEHWNAAIKGNTVTSSGEVRQSSVTVSRSYTYNADSVACSVSLGPALADRVYQLYGGAHGLRGYVREAYEMIPFVDIAKRYKNNPRFKDKLTRVVGVDAEGEVVGALSATVFRAKKVIIDLRGYGCIIEFERAMPVRRGQHDTVLVSLAQSRTPAAKIKLNYTITPYVGRPGAINLDPPKKEHRIARVGKLDSPSKVGTATALSPKTHPAVWAKQTLGTVKFAVAGDQLAVEAEVRETRFVRADPVWRGSCVEIFGSMPGTVKIGQVFLTPKVKEAPAAGFKKSGDKIVPAPEIRVTSKAVPQGYILHALIPMKLLTLDSSKDIFMLEAQIGIRNRKGKALYSTLFGSKRAYQNNVDYAPFRTLTPEQLKPQ